MEELEADEIISYIDVNGDDKIDYEEFLLMMQNVELRDFHDSDHEP